MIFWVQSQLPAPIQFVRLIPFAFSQLHDHQATIDHQHVIDEKQIMFDLQEKKNIVFDLEEQGHEIWWSMCNQSVECEEEILELNNQNGRVVWSFGI